MRERERECENIFVKRICNRHYERKDRWKVRQNMCSKWEEEAEVFAANVFRVSSTRRRRRFRIFFSLFNPVDSRGKVTTNATNNVVIVCSSNRCFFLSLFLSFLSSTFALLLCYTITCTWSRRSCSSKKKRRTCSLDHDSLKISRVLN